MGKAFALHKVWLTSSIKRRRNLLVFYTAERSFPMTRLSLFDQQPHGLGSVWTDEPLLDWMSELREDKYSKVVILEGTSRWNEKAHISWISKIRKVWPWLGLNVSQSKGSNEFWGSCLLGVKLVLCDHKTNHSSKPKLSLNAWTYI